MKRRKGYYSISVVAEMFSVHQQTVRMYEKEGLISPKRTEGNTRMFSEEDVDRLEEVINLTHKMGVNLVGVQIILKLQKKIKKLQDEMNKMFEHMHGNLEEESEEYKKDAKKQGQRLVEMKHEGTKKIKKEGGPIDVGTPVDVKNEKSKMQSRDDDWEIEYEEDE